MGRKNHRPRGGTLQANRLPIEKMAVPRGRCYLRSRKGKLRFATEVEAARALEQAQAARHRIHSEHIEKRFYQCLVADGGCGDYHLTSRETWTPKETPPCGS